MGIADKVCVLVLNGVWQPIGQMTVKEAFNAMLSDSKGAPAAQALNIQYEKNEDGSWNFDEPTVMEPVDWERWTELPVRDFDFQISTANKTYRVPTVIVATHFKKMPMKELRPSKMKVLERDGFVCQYTGKKLTKGQATIDHVVPKSRGGRDKDWKNMVACDKKVNHKKGNKTNQEAGLELIKQPRRPLPMPVSSLIKKVKHPSWRPFITEKV